jgi:probable phosphoglycerate mutase
MKTIYLIRHGEAENNVRSGDVYKAEDSELTPKGFEQAKILAERAQHLPVDVLIASPFVRTRQTAEEISHVIGKPIEYNELFEECRTPSQMKNARWDDEAIKKVHVAWQKSLLTDGEQVGDGDTYASMMRRGGMALDYLEKRPEENILIVTHGFLLRVLVAKMLFTDEISPQLFREFEYGFRTQNTGLTVLHFDPTDAHRAWWLSVWNDHAHLAD